MGEVANPCIIDAVRDVQPFVQILKMCAKVHEDITDNQRCYDNPGANRPRKILL